MKKTFYFVRHGETDWNVLGKLQGQTDIPLNENGIKQARALSERIKDLKVDYIFSSPLSRAYNTAFYLSEKFGLEIVTSSFLSEMGFGDFEGNVPPLDIDKATLKNWDEKVPNGESFKDCFLRFEHFVNSLDENVDNVLIVSHGAFLRVILRYYSADDISLTNCVCIACEYDTEARKFSKFRCV